MSGLRHPTAQLLLVASYIIVAHFVLGVLAGGFPDAVPVRGLQQSLTN